MKALKAVYWFAFILEVITLIPWTIIAISGGSAAFELMLGPNLTNLWSDVADFSLHLLMVLPFLLTLTIFILHIKSYAQLKRQGFVSRELIRWQSAIGIAVAVSFSFTVFMLSNLDCFDACTYPTNHWLTTSLPIAAICLLISLGLVFLPYHLNRKLKPTPKNTR